jgi:ZIP family zinc transporter/zinc and cadmium transporter
LEDTLENIFWTALGAAHLLPQAETEHKKYSLLSLGAGILVALANVLSKA